MDRCSASVRADEDVLADSTIGCLAEGAGGSGDLDSCPGAPLRGRKRALRPRLTIANPHF